MFIKVSADKTISFEELDDFKRFKIVSHIPRENVDRLSGALDGLAVLEDAQRAWVCAEALRNRVPCGQDEHWRKSYQLMIDASRKYGYIRDNPLEIASHIEWKSGA